MEKTFEILGKRGKYQKIIISFVILSGFFMPILGLSLPFLIIKPILLCKQLRENEYQQDQPQDNSLPSYNSYNSHYFNFTENFKKCKAEELCLNEKFIYKKSEESLFNIANEFDLYCNRSYLLNLLGTAFFLGNMLSYALLSPLPDKYGRKKMTLILVFLHLVNLINIFLTFNIYNLIMNFFISGITNYATGISILFSTELIDL